MRVRINNKRKNFLSRDYNGLIKPNFRDKLCATSQLYGWSIFVCLI
jgi:hypothetical protein